MAVMTKHLFANAHLVSRGSHLGVAVGGKELSGAEAAALAGMSEKTLKSRLARGWPVETALRAKPVAHVDRRAAARGAGT